MSIATILTAATFAVLAGIAMALFRAFAGPNVFDRVLAVNTIGTKTVLLIALLGFVMGRPDFLDIALLYALMNFIGTIAVLKWVKYGSLGRDVAVDGGTSSSGADPRA